MFNSATPKRQALPDWTGEDVYVLGGGPSLRDFDWNRLQDRNTIGCNQAFLHGASICNICCFGDPDFWRLYSDQLFHEYGGWVVSNLPRLTEKGLPDQPPQWVHIFQRLDRGLSSEPDALAWNMNTGSVAIHLALLLGARRIYLLGFDCTGTHWHDEGPRAQVQNPVSFNNFQEGMKRIADELPKVFPGREIVNVSDGTSKLTAFPILNIKDVFAQEGVAA